MRRMPWGFWVALISVVLTVVALSLRPVQHHYLSFTLPVVDLWKGLNPYGVQYPGGQYHYAPSSLVYFFSLFAFFPPLVGQALYVSIEAVFFGYCLFRLLATLKKSLGFDIYVAPWRNLFWIMFSSELVGSMLATKLEITLTALNLLALATLLEKRSPWWAALLLGIGIAWKFQPLPIAGLVALVLLIQDRNWKFPLKLSACIAAVLAMALPFFDWEFYVQLHTAWIRTLALFSKDAWLAPVFQHVYRFSLVCLGGTPSYAVASSISLCVGLVFACFLLWWVRTCRLPNNEKTPLALLAAFGMGSAFTVLFGPLSQSNAYLIYTPLLPAVWVFARYLKMGPRAWGCVVVSAYLLISIFYSDLTPRPIYRWIYDHALKPLGVLLLLGLLVASMLRARGLQHSPGRENA